MLRLKEGVKLTDLCPQMVLAAVSIDALYGQYGVLECWITSANDSTHSEQSWHYKGRALDFRTHNYLGNKTELVARIKVNLGDDYDVVLEAVGTSNEHLHVEYDPK